MKRQTAIIFCMGRELLEGTVLDRNANFMASHVTEAGFRVRTIQVLDDTLEEAVPVFEHALSLQPRFLLVTGGMGPGHDDITRECLARAVGVPMAVDETAKQHLQSAYRRLVAHGDARHHEINEARLTMATVPEGSESFENPVGTAPAIRFDTGNTIVFLMPGQPEELRRIFQEYVEPVLKSEAPAAFRAIEKLECPGRDESTISRMLHDLSRRHHSIHARARLHGTAAEARMVITLSAEGADEDETKAQLDAAAKDLRARLGLEVGGMTD
ncbi:MAG: competence/damage-inducible protein A [Planctomycetes bacterium]|nr:competence/damage-inducible protein A [Planctomycetota bacterium]